MWQGLREGKRERERQREKGSRKIRKRDTKYRKRERESETMHSVTSLGNLLQFGQIFIACCNNFLTQIAYIFWQFL